jgi:Tfp pilus assembly protein PilN
LSSELDRTNGLLRGRQQEIDDYKTRNSRLEQSLVEYRTIEAKVRDYEGKIAMLTQEIERLTNLLRAKNDEVDRMNINYKRIEEEAIYLKSHESKLAESERIIKSLNATIDGLRRDLSKW